MATSAVNAVTWMSQLSLQWMGLVEDRNIVRIRFYISVKVCFMIEQALQSFILMPLKD